MVGFNLFKPLGLMVLNASPNAPSPYCVVIGQKLGRVSGDVALFQGYIMEMFPQMLLELLISQLHEYMPSIALMKLGCECMAEIRIGRIGSCADDSALCHFNCSHKVPVTMDGEKTQACQNLETQETLYAGNPEQ